MKTITEINTGVIEGKLLLAAMAIITTECRRDKQPDEVLSEILTLSKAMYPEQSMSEQFVGDVQAAIDKGELTFGPTEEFERFHPESSQVSRTKYYEDMNVFEVEFKFGGKVYHYADVPFEVWIEAGKTDSIGSFVNKQIKPFYDYKQADDILFTPPPKSKTTEPKTLNTRGL